MPSVLIHNQEVQSHRFSASRLPPNVKPKDWGGAFQERMGKVNGYWQVAWPKATHEWEGLPCWDGCWLLRWDDGRVATLRDSDYKALT